MPIEKVPIVHRFGILSHSHRLDLQERLLQKTLDEKQKSEIGKEAKFEFEISDEVIDVYNALASDERTEFDVELQAILNKAKRKCGLLSHGEGAHVDTALSWIDLGQLLQCRGKLLQDSILTLYHSLNEASVEVSQISSLFFLAEVVVHTVRTNVFSAAPMEYTETLILKVGFLVFLRLYVHYMGNELGDFSEEKARLSSFFYGLEETQNSYAAYPECLLALRFILNTGTIITSSSQAEEENNQDRPKMPTGASKERPEDAPVVANEQLSRSVHELSPVLWHSLDVWRCVFTKDPGLDEAVFALETCGRRMSKENWVDAVCAFYVLESAARFNIRVVRSLQKLSCGPDRVPATAATCISFGEPMSQQEGVGLLQWPWELVISYIDVLTNVCLYSRSASIQKIVLTGDKSSPEDSFNLLTFLYFGLEDQGDVLAEWVWQVRHAAVRSLWKIHKTFQGNPQKDGICSTAWNHLNQLKSKEKNRGVLDAFQIALLDESTCTVEAKQSFLSDRIATKLSKLYIPTDNSSSVATPTTFRSRSSRSEATSVVSSLPQWKPNRLTIGQELVLANLKTTPKKTEFKKRTSGELMAIVKDQWKKEMTQKHSDDCDQNWTEIKKDFRLDSAK